jgi:hypothetical protein
VEEELIREKLAKIADRIKAMRERQASAVAEGIRIHDAATKGKRWPKPLLSSLNDLADTEKGLAQEISNMVEDRFQQMKVVARMLERSSEAMRDAGDLIVERRDEIKNRPEDEFDADAEKLAAEAVKVLQATALRRLDQLLDAIKFDPQMAQGGGGGQGQGQGPPDGGGEMPSGPPPDGLPPLAQLKALRALQQEASDRTAALAKAYPDPAKMPDSAKDELKAIQRLQRDVKELIQELIPDEAPPEAKP